MAQRKNDGGGFLIIAAALLFALLIAAGFIGPIAILVCWVIAELRAAKVKSVRSIDDLLPTPNERALLANIEQLIQKCRVRIDSANADGDNAAIPRRNDGQFDGRSRKGKELNALIAGAECDLSDALEKKSDWEHTVYGRIDDWARRRAGAFGARTGVFSWFGLMTIGYVVRPEWMLGIGGIIAKTYEYQILFGASVVSTVCSALIIWLSSRIQKGTLVNTVHSAQPLMAGSP